MARVPSLREQGTKNAFQDVLNDLERNKGSPSQQEGGCAQKCVLLWAEEMVESRNLGGIQ